jgi:excisionase family DNA binding protein
MLTKKELAAKLKVHENTIDRRVKEGMPHIKVGKAVRFDIDEVMAWLRGVAK